MGRPRLGYYSNQAIRNNMAAYRDWIGHNADIIIALHRHDGGRRIFDLSNGVITGVDLDLDLIDITSITDDFRHYIRGPGGVEATISFRTGDMEITEIAGQPAARRELSGIWLPNTQIAIPGFAVEDLR